MGIKNTDFWIFRLGQALSEIGDICGAVALSWWLLEKTGSGGILAAVIGPVTFLRMFLTVLFGPIADRFSKKKLALASDLIRGVLWFILATLSILPQVYLPTVILAYGLTSIGSALFSAVIMPMIFDLSGEDHRAEAMRVAQTITSGATLIGAIFGGLVVGWMGYQFVLFLNAATFFVGFFATLFIDMPHAKVTSPTKSTVWSSWNTWVKDTSDGARYIWRHSTLRSLGLIFMGVEFLLAPSAILLPVLIKMEHRAPAWLLGGTYAVRSAGALVCLALVKRIQKYVEADALILQALVVLMGVGYFLFSLTGTPFTALVGALFLGGSLAGVQVILIPRISRTIDPAYQSRAFTCLGFLAEIGTPLGIAVTGLILDLEHVGLFCLVIAVVLVLYSFVIRLIPSYGDFWRREG